MRDRIWRTRDGQLIPVSLMETRHIWNCIRMIERSIAYGKPWRIEYLERLQLEILIRDIIYRQ
jgi:hypothetical protein